MLNKKIIAVDFDGTLCQLHPSKRPYRPKSEITEKPNLEVVSEIKSLRRKGFKIVIYSSRWWGDYNSIKNWLHSNKIPFDDIVLGKFKADLFIDDTTVNPVHSENWKMKIENILDL